MEGHLRDLVLYDVSATDFQPACNPPNDPLGFKLPEAVAQYEVHITLLFGGDYLSRMLTYSDGSSLGIQQLPSEWRIGMACPQSSPD